MQPQYFVCAILMSIMCEILLTEHFNRRLRPINPLATSWFNILLVDGLHDTEIYDLSRLPIIETKLHYLMPSFAS